MKIYKAILKMIYKQAEKEAPLEACGYLAGHGDVITAHYEMTNVDKSKTHYTLDPKEQFQVAKNVRANGSELIAVYHSHPTSPARPSKEDIRLAHDSSIIYLIVSLENGNRTCGAFRIKNGSVTSEPLEII